MTDDCRQSHRTARPSSPAPSVGVVALRGGGYGLRVHTALVPLVQPRGERGLIIVGVAAMAISTFLPHVEPTGAFRMVGGAGWDVRPWCRGHNHPMGYPWRRCLVG